MARTTNIESTEVAFLISLLCWSLPARHKTALRHRPRSCPDKKAACIAEPLYAVAFLSACRGLHVATGFHCSSAWLCQHWKRYTCHTVGVCIVALSGYWKLHWISGTAAGFVWDLVWRVFPELRYFRCVVAKSLPLSHG